MRDIVVVLFISGACVAALKRPWLGVLALAIMGYLNPHRYAWGFSMTLPLYFVLFVVTCISIFLHPEERSPFPWTRETVLFIMILLWFTVTTFVSPDIPDAAREQWEKVMKVYIGIFPTLWLINSREKLRWLIVTIAMSFGIIGFKGGLFSLAKGFNHRTYGPDATFYAGNNEIALALNITLPLIMLSAKETSNRYVKLFFYATFVLSICTIIGSWSRGGLVALMLVLGGLILLGKRKWLTIPLIIMGIMLITPQLPDEWFARMHTIKTYDEDQSVQGRFLAWEYAKNKVRQNPVMGGGFQTFRNAWCDSHSAYFQMLGEHGLTGFFLWISLVGGTLLTLQRLKREWRSLPDHWIINYARAIQLSIIAYMAGGAFLGVGYWDILYHLIAITAVLTVLSRQELAVAQPVVSTFPFSVKATTWGGR